MSDRDAGRRDVRSSPEQGRHALQEGLDGDAGYATGLGLEATELEQVRSCIEAQWLGHLRQRAPDHAGIFAALGLARYHERAHLVDHAALWPKRARILPPDAVAAIRRTSLVRALEAEFGPFEISDEDAVGWEEVYWRLVRPHTPSDRGPLHADQWFWDLGHGRMPPGRRRVKVWVAVVCEPGRSGLRLVPGSHRRQWRYHGEWRHGMMKPQIDEDEEALGAELIATSPGDAVVFHDSLLHGGALNLGALTRVSFEFTMFVCEKEG